MADLQIPDSATVRENYLAGVFDDGVGREADPEEFDRWLNAEKDAAFREGIEALKDQLLHVDYHPQSTGVWHPYAYREWDGGYGKSL